LSPSRQGFLLPILIWARHCQIFCFDGEQGDTVDR
jgi:hypothetical protein